MTTCDMSKTCTEPVTHLGEKGYVYCATHAPLRRGWERVRKMRAWEIRWVNANRALPTYRVEPEPKEGK